MVKTNPWLRSLLRAGQQQQRATARALDILLTPPKPAKAKAAKAKVAKPKVARKSKAKPAAPKNSTAAAPPSFTPLLRKALAASFQRPPEPATVHRVPLDAPAPARGKWLTSHYTTPAEPGRPAHRLSYWLYLPDRAPPASGFPLVVMLHGCEQSATLFAQGTRMNQHADRAGYAVLYPQQSLSAHPHRCWHWFDRASQRGGGEVPTIAAIVRKVQGNYPIDRSRVYLGGLSAGAAMANILALSYPELFAAVGLHSAPLFGASHGSAAALGVMQRGASVRAGGAIAEVLDRNAAFPAMPTLLIQGEEDPVVRLVNQTQLEHQAMLLNRLPPGSRVEVVSKPGKRDTHPYSVRDVYQGNTVMLRVVRIAELKHAWCGGDERVTFNCGAGPDASRMLLEFFAKHRRTPGS